MTTDSKIDRPFPHLHDLLRGRDGDALGPLVLKIVDASIDETRPSLDVQTAAILSAAMVVVELTRAERLPKRRRDAEQLFAKFLRSYAAQVKGDGRDRVRDQLESQLGIAEAFGKAWPAIADTPVPPRFVQAGVVDADRYREVIMASDLQHLLSDAFAAAQVDHSADWSTLTFATIAAAGVVCGGAYDTTHTNDEAHAELIAGMFRDTVLNTIRYWRQQKAS
jgi:hypothetical protein